MIVEVLYFAEFKDITGKEKEEFELSSNQLKVLIELLLAKYELPLRDLLWDENTQNISNLISIIINNQALLQENPLLAQLNDGDVIAFLMPVSGG
ncbi:MAG: MoaD family protein [Candidatus Lokiarchaeota archaeon]|nr:MoaD family protein [Candidatus Lokiarchaeota archaeon]